MSYNCYKSCRACLLQDNEISMFDLSVPETLDLFQECTNVVVNGTEQEDELPQYLCSMCYRLCELWQGFRERAQETERKLIRTHRKRPAPGSASKATVAPNKPRPPKKKKVKPDASRDEVSEEESFRSEDENEDPAEFKELEFKDVDIFDDPIEEDEVSTESPKRHSNAHPQHTPKPRNKTTKINTEELVFGPVGKLAEVWKYFLRDETRLYSKCNVDGCGKICTTPKGTTSGMRAHLKTHKIYLPPRGGY